MEKIDPAFLFEIGDQLRRVRRIDTTTSFAMAYVVLDTAASQIERVLNESIYNHIFRAPCRIAAFAVLDQMRAMGSDMIETDNWDNQMLKAAEIGKLQALYAKFETLFLGDLQTCALYLVSPKGGFDTDHLIEFGQSLFSGELSQKVPSAIPDLKAATRCISFVLPTAAGFHLHRAHESVLRVYWDCVTGGAKRPKQNNMGVYLRELDKRGAGKPAVRSHLRSIKDFHRNPLMHPEQSLENIDEALDLLAAIRCSIGYMLKEIPADYGAPLLEDMGPPPPVITHVSR
jgi:hypothetical protein